MSTSTAPPFGDEPVAPGRRNATHRWFQPRPGSPQANSDLDPGPLVSTRLYRRRRYSSSTLSVLTRQYVKVRGDFIVAIGDPEDLDKERHKYARTCSEYLRAARGELEGRRTNFIVASSLLFLAEVTLVWLYPRGMLESRADGVQAQLERLQPRVPWLERSVAQARQRKDDDRFLRTALEYALNFVQQHDQDSAIAEELQVTRLRSLILYITAALGLLLIAVPYVTITLGAGIDGWPVVQFGQDWLTQIVSASAVSVIGAVGGIFSGLISVRDTSTTLIEYRTSMLELALKPLVGAVAALTLYLLLSWQILTGVQVTNGGTFLLAGFLAGFSERYFLRLLKADVEREQAQHVRAVHDAIAVAPAAEADGPRGEISRFDERWGTVDSDRSGPRRESTGEPDSGGGRSAS